MNMFEDGSFALIGFFGGLGLAILTVGAILLYGQSSKPDVQEDLIVPSHDDCDLDYYEVRAGKCPNAQVVHGKVFCSNPNCRENDKD
jgi:hypothetical protein